MNLTDINNPQRIIILVMTWPLKNTNGKISIKCSVNIYVSQENPDVPSDHLTFPVAPPLGGQINLFQLLSEQSL